jgi:hypothetical protein
MFNPQQNWKGGDQKIGLTFQPKWWCKFWLAPRPIMVSILWRLSSLLALLRLDFVSGVVSRYSVNLNVIIYNFGPL